MTADLHRALGRLESKVDLLLERAQSTEEAHREAAQRLTKLEHESTATKAAAGVIAGLVAVAGAMMDKLWGHP
jgi:hypothetical protein